MNLPENTQTEILQAIRSGKKIVAVKIYREATGKSLRDSLEFVESLAQNPNQNPSSETSSDRQGRDPQNTDAILDAIFQGKKIKAVKLYKESTGASLMESKEFVESLTEQLKADSPDQFVVRKSGCVSVLLVAVAIAGLLAASGWT